MIRRRTLAAAIAMLLTSLVAPATGAEGEPVAFRCDGNGGIPAMENAWITATGAGACWAHLGHHTYDAGAVRPVHAVSGSIFTVEVQLSPPVELASPTSAAIVFEGSVAGTTWTTLHSIPYPLTGSTRQGIDFSFDAGGEPARFLRIRQPRSSARGLSGYLDSSRFDAMLGAPVEAASAAASGSFACERDIMERIFAEHPCTFGGLNRYDAPSFFHTYPLGASRLERVAGSAVLLPWRLDDYTQGGGSRTATSLLVQASADGATWVDLGSAAGTYGLPIPFAFDGLGGTEARYVRLVGERHTRYEQASQFPSNKHARGYIVWSGLEIDESLAA